MPHGFSKQYNWLDDLTLKEKTTFEKIAMKNFNLMKTLNTGSTYW